MRDHSRHRFCLLYTSERSIRELRLQHGIIVGGPLFDFKGILTGVPDVLVSKRRKVDGLSLIHILKIQRTFLTERGLPERPWFKHQVYAPGAYTGYGAKPIAAVREYMDEKKWTEAEAQVPGVAKVLEDVAAAIGKAADDLEATTGSGR